MKTSTKTKPCFYCSLTIDLATDDYERIDTLRSALGREEQAYAHELCAAQADEEAEQDRAMDNYLVEQHEYAGSIYYEELFNEDF